MFKHVLISLIIIVIIYFIVKGLNVFFHKIIVSKNISKYHMSENDMSLINTYSELFKNNTNQFIFYTTVPWNGITNNNYITAMIKEPKHWYLEKLKSLAI